MKIIILYASAGAGHRRAAEAIYKAFLSKEQRNVILIDALDYTDPFFKKLYADGYEFVVKYLPLLWAAIFYLCDSKIIRPVIFFLRSFINSRHSKRLEKYLEDEQPDLVIATQFFLVELITRMRKRQSAKFKFVVVITDFNVHSFWVSNYVDEYIVASDFTKNILINKFSIKEEKIRTLGIPIHSHFSTPKDRVSLAHKFSLDQSKFSVLIIAGTFGMGPLKRVAKLLVKHAQVIVGCGKNEKLLNNLLKLSRLEKNLKPIGFVDYIDELMALSDIIITKPGGLTISESLAMDLPMIFISAIKGQETNNAKVMVDLGIGFIPRDIKEIILIVSNLRSNPTRLSEIKQNIEKFAKVNSAEEIAKHLLE